MTPNEKVWTRKEILEAETRIGNSIAEQVRLAVESLYPKRWKKAYHVLREIAPPGGIFMVVLSLVAIVVTLIIGVTSRREADAVFRTKSENFQTQTEERLKNIEKTLSSLSLVRAQSVAEKYSTVTPKELTIHREELKQVKTALAELPLKTSPGYWTVSFQIITLFSKANFDVEKIAEQPESILEDLISNRPGVVELDHKRVVLRNLVQGVTIKDSIVRFEPSVRLSNDIFINCVFLFPVVETPSRPLQEIGTELLCSDLSKVTLNAS